MPQNFTCEIAVGVLARKIGTETVLLSLHDGAYYSLNAIGSNIWESVASGASFVDIVDSLTSRYRIDRGVATSDVIELLQNLERRHLITLSERTAPPSGG